MEFPELINIVEQNIDESTLQLTLPKKKYQKKKLSKK